jgi:PIN domain nuclease of toxin-antitoxin system
MSGPDPIVARALLDSYGLRVEPVLREDAEWAARRWVAGEGLSLGDRICLAAGARFDEDVLTADTSWGTEGRIRQIR